MAYNIDTAQFVGLSTLTIGGADVRALVEEHAESLPANNLLDAILEKTAGRHMGMSRVPGLHLDDTKDYPIEASRLWSGEWSGNSYDVLVEKILPVTSGSADIILTWEGGDAHSGVRVRDGVVTKHKVVLALGEQE